MPAGGIARVRVAVTDAVRIPPIPRRMVTSAETIDRHIAGATRTGAAAGAVGLFARVGRGSGSAVVATGGVPDGENVVIGVGSPTATVSVGRSTAGTVIAGGFRPIAETPGRAIGAGAQPHDHVQVHVEPLRTEPEVGADVHDPEVQFQFQIHVVGTVTVGVGAPAGIPTGVAVAPTETGDVAEPVDCVTGPLLPGLRMRTSTFRLARIASDVVAAAGVSPAITGLAGASVGGVRALGVVGAATSAAGGVASPGCVAGVAGATEDAIDVVAGISIDDTTVGAVSLLFVVVSATGWGRGCGAGAVAAGATAGVGSGAGGGTVGGVAEGAAAVASATIAAASGV